MWILYIVVCGGIYWINGSGIGGDIVFLLFWWCGVYWDLLYDRIEKGYFECGYFGGGNLGFNVYVVWYVGWFFLWKSWVGDGGVFFE